MDSVDNKNEVDSLSEALSLINSHLKKMGMLEIAIVSPKDCIPQDKNARYFKPEIFQQLVNNIKDAGNLESLPLAYRHESIEGKYRTVSGHHRIEGASAAGLETIMILVADIDPNDTDMIISKQLSHNELVGRDDKITLFELFNSIKRIDLKIATGLNNELENVEYSSLSFKIGEFREFSVLFLPDQHEKFESGMKRIAEDTNVKPKTSVQLAPMAIYDKFAHTLQSIKKAEDIKSNAVALVRLVELALPQVKEIVKQKSAEKKKDSKRNTSKKPVVESRRRRR